MKNKIEPYSPCPCGSGKKYKFCCYLKRDQMSAASGSRHSLTASAPYPDREISALLDKETFNKGFQLMQSGLRMMNSGKYKKAIPILRQALETAPEIEATANNLAICLLTTGKLAEAKQVQKKILETSSMPNPFGMINLATFYYIEGDEFNAQRMLKQALNSKIPSVDSCVKVCEMLTRFKRHRDILDFVSKTEWDHAPKVSFYTGIAAANLGDFKRAKKDLQRVPVGDYKMPMVRRYLQHLRDNTAPHTIRGDWPYLMPSEVCPFGIEAYATEGKEELWRDRAIFVDFCEALLNQTSGDPMDAMNILAALKHPNATDLLLTIAKGKYGPDSLRLKALDALRMKGVQLDDDLEIFFDGQYQKLADRYTTMNPDFQFGEPLPKKLNQQYIKAVISLQSKRPDWKFIDKTFQLIIREKPDFYPAQFNYGAALIARDRRDEAEPLIRAVVDKHPEYLFARSALIQLLLSDDNAEAAKELIGATPPMKETHPEAMGAWIIAQALYYRHLNDHDNAVKSTMLAHAVAPDLPLVHKLSAIYDLQMPDQ